MHQPAPVSPNLVISLCQTVLIQMRTFCRSWSGFKMFASFMLSADDKGQQGKFKYICQTVLMQLSADDKEIRKR